MPGVLNGSWRRGALGAALLVALLALALAGCGRWTPALPGSSGGGAVTSVHVLRTSAFPPNHIPPLERTVTDAVKARQLYAALRALPPFPKETMSCPMDIGVSYDLTFYQGQTQVSWATVQPTGCEAVTLPNGDVRWAVNQDQFWATLAEALGVSKSDLFQAPRSSGPSAPTPLPGQP